MSDDIDNGQPPVPTISDKHRDKCARLAERLIDSLFGAMSTTGYFEPEKIAALVTAIEGLSRIARGV